MEQVYEAVMEETAKKMFGWIFGSAVSIVLFYLIWMLLFTPLFSLPKLSVEQTVIIGMVLRTLFTFSP